MWVRLYFTVTRKGFHSAVLFGAAIRVSICCCCESAESAVESIVLTLLQFVATIYLIEFSLYILVFMYVA